MDILSFLALSLIAVAWILQFNSGKIQMEKQFLQFYAVGGLLLALQNFSFGNLFYAFLYLVSGLIPLLILKKGSK